MPNSYLPYHLHPDPHWLDYGGSAPPPPLVPTDSRHRLHSALTPYVQTPSTHLGVTLFGELDQNRLEVDFQLKM